jgi:hypothetical protein
LKNLRHLKKPHLSRLGGCERGRRLVLRGR